MKQILHTGTALVILAQLVMMPAGSQGLVLCVGEDGHVALERAKDGEHCCTESPSDKTVPAEYDTSRYPAGSCGVCTDLPLGPAGGHSAATLTRPAGPSHDAAALLAAVAVEPAAAPSVGPGLGSVPSFRIENLHLSLRTTVLLI